MIHKALCGFAILLATLTSVAQAEPVWPTFRNGPANGGQAHVAVKDLLNQTISRPVSQYASGGLIWGTAVIGDDDTIYFGSADKHAYALSPAGEKLWDYRIFDRADALIDSAPALTASGKLVIPGGDGFLHAVDAHTGTALWTFKAHHVSDADHQQGASVNSFEGNVQAGPNGLIYAGSDNGYMYAVKDDGTEAWSFKTGMMIWSTPAFAPDMSWMAFGSLDGNLYILNPETGAEIARYKTGGDVKSSPAISADGHIYVGSSDQYLYAFHLEPGLISGQRLVKDWAVKTKGEVYSSPSLLGDVLVVGSLDGTVYAVKTTGETLWSYEANSPVAGSPAVTNDGVIFFGAKNGKLYALDLATGERIFSYKATDGYLKSNLDASPAVGRDGKVYIGSYGGILYGIPFEFCARHTTDQRCAFGGKEDRPDFGGPVGDNEATLRYEDRAGQLHVAPDAKVGLSQMLRLRLVAIEHGDYLQEAAVSPTHLTVTLTPGNAEIEAIISSDGKYLNIEPKGFFAADTDYKIEVSGRYFISTSWLWDRLRWIDHGSMATSVTFHTAKPLAGALPGSLLAGDTAQWGIASLYLYQPQALDTYIPAALDGQGFVMTAFAYNQENGRFLMLGQPALPRGDGGALPLAEPTKAFVLESAHQDGAIKGTGAFKIAAMGGSIPFQRVTFAANLTPDSRLDQGEFLAMANCLTIGGSGGSYQFPLGMIHTVCDPWMRLIGVGRFEQVAVAEQTPVAAVLAGVEQGASGALAIKLAGTAQGDDRDHLLTAVRYDANGVLVSAFGAIAIKGQDLATGTKVWQVPMGARDADPSPTDQVAVFLDQKLLRILTVP